MRIVHVVTTLSRGGIETLVAELSQAQVQANHEVAVCAARELGVLHAGPADGQQGPTDGRGELLPGDHGKPVRTSLPGATRGQRPLPAEPSAETSGVRQSLVGPGVL